MIEIVGCFGWEGEKGEEGSEVEMEMVMATETGTGTVIFFPPGFIFPLCRARLCVFFCARVV